MFKKTIQASILALFFCVLPGCMAPEAIKTDIQGIRNKMGALEKVVDQKADNTVVAERIDQVNNKIEQTAQIAEELSVWRKSVQAETINYGGAGWVVVGVGIVVLIFVGAGLLLIRAFMKRGNMLTLLTGAVKKTGEASPQFMKAVKYNLKRCVHEGGCTEHDRQNIGKFAKKVGTFAEQKHEFDV